MAHTVDSYTVTRRATARRVWGNIEGPLWARLALSLVAFALPRQKRTIGLDYTEGG